MKALTFIALLTICVLFGCSKKSNPTPKTWISGKWRMTIAYADTTTATHNVDVAVYNDELNFINDHTVTSYGANTSFEYSLQNMTINEGGLIYKIRKVSDTRMDLIYYGPEFKRLEQFTKE